MTTLRPALLLLVASLLTACGGGSDDGGANPPPSASTPSANPGDTGNTGDTALPAASTCGLPQFRSEMLALLNQARAQARACGTQNFSAAPALGWDDQLFAAAAAHAEDMARNDYFSHDSQDGRTFSQRITDAGYDWSAAGENIAAGQADVAQVVNAWLDSPGHCANIMSDAFSEVGVACVADPQSTYTHYWAMSLAWPG